MRFAPTSVRARLTLWYTFVLTLPLAAFAVASYVVFTNALYNRTDAFVRDALTVFGREVVSERRTIPRVIDAIHVTLSEVRFQELEILVFDERAELLAMTARRGEAASRPTRPDSAGLMAALSRHGVTSLQGDVQTVSLSTGSYRVLAQPHSIDDRGVTLVGVFPLHEVMATLARIRHMFFIAIPLLIASAAAGGWFLAKRSFQPVATMTARAAEIGATNLHERLPVANDDELGALARVINSLLVRLEASFEQQRRFMADASHELRTPAAVLRAEADITLSRPNRSEGEYRQSMGVVQDAARRLTRIVDDIFLLARADAGHLVMRPEDVDVHEVVIDSVRAVQAIAAQRAVRIEIKNVAEGRVHGDADLLGRVLLNLLDNAVKHAPDGSAVVVGMSNNRLHIPRFARDDSYPARDDSYSARDDSRGEFVVTVTDSGPGIPAESQARVFERFYRADAARARPENTATSGAGLGLPIARRIAEMHGGDVELVESCTGRTTFRFWVPLEP